MTLALLAVTDRGSEALMGALHGGKEQRAEAWK
jgi:hypothetical protein